MKKMEFKGTKGKWVYNHNLVATLEPIIDDTICVCPSLSNKNWEANALLISKAPEMLEMLKVLLNEPRIKEAQISSGSNSSLNYNISKVEKLIREATILNL